MEVRSLKNQLEIMERKAKQRGKEIKRLRKDFDQTPTRKTTSKTWFMIHKRQWIQSLTS